MRNWRPFSVCATVSVASLGWSMALLGGEQRTPPAQGKLRVGMVAPDFTLKHLASDKEFRLSSNLGKRPTVLIFGSYT